MNIQVIGVNHHSAPLELREKLAISERQLPEALTQLCRHPAVAGGMILSTCNRVEVIAESASEGAELCNFLHNYFGVPLPDLQPHLYEYRRRDAIHHIFRVASSLDSMVVGEPQILGQVKEAYAIARAAGVMSPLLDRLLTRSFAVAKKVRTETSVGSSAVSVASVAVELAQEMLGSLANKCVYLVGAGEMSELAARHLRARRAGSIFVSSRNYDRATQLAQSIHGKAVHYEEIYETCALADIVISASAAPHIIFRREHGERLLARRRNRPMFFIDISVPRTVDPEMNRLEGIFVYDIDDLQQTVAEHTAKRRKEAERAEAIVAAEVERFRSNLQTLDIVPTIVSLQQRMENIRKSEIARARSRLGRLSVEQEAALDAITRSIVNKLMHSPISALKTAARDEEVGTLLPVVERLFDIAETKAADSVAGAIQNVLNVSSA
jgi:glutamyl-tRNA reductase